MNADEIQKFNLEKEMKIRLLTEKYKDENVIKYVNGDIPQEIIEYIFSINKAYRDEIYNIYIKLTPNESSWLELLKYLINEYDGLSTLKSIIAILKQCAIEHKHSSSAYSKYFKESNIPNIDELIKIRNNLNNPRDEEKERMNKELTTLKTENEQMKQEISNLNNEIKNKESLMLEKEQPKQEIILEKSKHDLQSLINLMRYKNFNSKKINCISKIYKQKVPIRKIEKLILYDFTEEELDEITKMMIKGE